MSDNVWTAGFTSRFDLRIIAYHRLWIMDYGLPKQKNGLDNHKNIQQAKTLAKEKGKKEKS